LTLHNTVLNAQPSFHLPTQFNDKEVWFDSLVGVSNSGIVNGPEYKLSARGAKTHPFFLTGDSSGKVKIGDYTYTGIIKYDTYSQTLVLKYVTDDNSIRFVELEKVKIQEFEIFDHLFKNIEGRGFCDVLLETNNLLLIASRTKKTTINDRMPDFQSVDFFYLVEGGKWKPLRTETSIIKLAETKDESRALRNFMRGQRIKTKGFFDEEKLVKVITYYDSLRKLPL